jgi:uncharacterized short protein YbdD (DUF466 family)
MTVVARLREGVTGVRWFVKGVLGEDAYDKYREHFADVHSDSGEGERMMTEREFWRDRSDRQEAHPESRCC